MNYNDGILENKYYNMARLLVYNFSLAVCILLALCLVFVLLFGFRPYVVLSNSEAPYFTTKDMVIVKKQNEYKVGDILTYHKGNSLVSHRLVAICEENGVQYYICHGDNVDMFGKEFVWQDKAKEWEGKELSWFNSDNAPDIDTFDITKIEGSVVQVVRNYGTYFAFIDNHKVLIITMVLGAWCISYVLKNEGEMNRARRLM